MGLVFADVLLINVRDESLTPIAVYALLDTGTMGVRHSR
jgi:hypothetical protein